jgi:hypothetical protein
MHCNVHLSIIKEDTIDALDVWIGSSKGNRIFQTCKPSENAALLKFRVGDLEYGLVGTNDDFKSWRSLLILLVSQACLS